MALQASIRGNDPAFSFLKDGETCSATLSFAALADRTRTLGLALRQCGLAGERVLLLYPTGLDFVTAFFGTLAAGATAVPAPHAQGSRASMARLQAIVADARPAAVLTTAELLASTRAALQGQPADVAPEAAPGAAEPALRITTMAELLAMAPLPAPQAASQPASQAASLAGAADLPAIDPSALALVQYTSGSTGTPRGVMVSHAAIQSNLALIESRFEHTPASVMVSWLPMFHDMGLIGSLLQPVYAGFHAVLMPPAAFLEDPVRWLRAITRYGATTSGAPNFAYDFCVDRIPTEDRATLDLRSWDIAYSGSEPVRARTLDRFATAFAPYGFRRAAFYPCYGMAEATLLVAGSDKETPPVYRTVAVVGQNGEQTAEQNGAPAPDPTAVALANRVVSCGKTGNGHDIQIVDPDSGTPLPSGATGEIWFSGPSVGTGYWNRPTESAATFGAQLVGRDDIRWLRTGDLGFMAEGHLFVTGRIKDVMILRGRNHYPQDIEATAEASHPDLRRDGSAAFLIEETDGPVRSDTGRATTQATAQAVIFVGEIGPRALRDPPLAEIAGAIRSAVSREHGLHVSVVALLKPGTLPKTTSGKVQRSRCKALYLAGDLGLIAEDRHGAAFWRPVP